MLVNTDWTLDADKQNVVAKIGSEVLVLPLAAVEGIVQGLGDYRAEMTPEVEASWAFGQTVAAIPDPGWVIEPETFLGGVFLHVRDPRFGWLHYVLPPQAAKTIGETLIKAAEVAPPAPQPGAMN
jgi:hypothetical protein